MTSLDDINGRSIQTLLRGENDTKQSDEFQAKFSVKETLVLSFDDFVISKGGFLDDKTVILP